MEEKNEIQILFKPLKYNKLQKNLLDSNNKLKYKEYNVPFDCNLIYNNLESCFPPRILNIKLCFFSFLQKESKDDNVISVSLDSIILYECINNKYNLLNDSDIFNEKDYKQNKDKIIYYNFNENKVNIRIEFFSNKIDHFYFNLSEMSSLFMIKYLIYLKLKNIEANNHYKTLTINNDNEKDNTINEIKKEIIYTSNTNYKYLIKLNEIENVIKLYGNGIINNTYQGYNNKNETNRFFINNTLLLTVLNYYLSFSTSRLNNSSERNDKKSMNLLMKESKEIIINIIDNNISIFNNCSEYTLSFIMTECKKDKLILGLDFRFNLLNYFSPYYMDEENKIESKSRNRKFLNKSKIKLYNGGGLKLFVYCLNQKCIYYSKYFVHHLGYGYFDLFNAMNSISCPICKKKGKNLIEIKYIGMINAKWAYKGFLTGLKYSNVEGQGITILNDVIYRTKEIIFSQQFLDLKLQIEKYFSYNTTITKEEKQKKYSTINTTYFTDNSNYSVTEEEDPKVTISDNNQINEIKKELPIKSLKYRIKKKKYKNRNQLRNYLNTSTANNNNPSCVINGCVNTENASCWDICIKNDKKENECLIF